MSCQRVVYGCSTLLIVLLVGCQIASPAATPTQPAAPAIVPQQPTRVSSVKMTPSATTMLPVASPEFTPTTNPDATVRQADTRLYARPLQSDKVIEVLDALTSLIVIGRIDDNSWVQVATADAKVGWVPATALDIAVNLDRVSVTAGIGEVLPTAMPSALPPGPVVTGITRRSYEIFLQGQQHGNRANVFSKVGDSLTVATYMLFPIGWDNYDLQRYGYLRPVIDYFSSAPARDSNSFSNHSLSADNGWTTRSVLNAELAHPELCSSGESPLVCEYRVVRPALSLILLGTNDVAELPAAEYRQNMQQIIDVTIDMGIIPVISTMPDRLGYETEVAQFNAIVRGLARANDVPLWDYGWAMRILPGGGLAQDGVHPSWPPGDISEAAKFNAWNMQYGYTVRNLTALQVLDAIWRQVIRPG